MTSFPVGTEPPLAVPIVLAGVAGFVDACTFLGLFGFFVAQVTGSYVLAGARPVAGWPGAAVVLAVPVFFAGGVAATMAAVAGHGVARRPLAAALALETLLLVAFAATFAARPLFGALEMPVVVASMFGLAAMGVQSATVRLLMRGVGSTNVMTTTTSQIAIDATQLTWAWLRREGGVADTQRQAGDMPAPAMERPCRCRSASSSVRCWARSGSRISAIRYWRRRWSSWVRLRGGRDKGRGRPHSLRPVAAEFIPDRLSAPAQSPAPRSDRTTSVPPLRRLRWRGGGAW